MSRINEHHEYPSQPCFVLYKVSELGKRPRVLLSPLASMNRDSRTDALKVFQGNTPSSVFSLRNNTLTDNMIDMSGKISLFARAVFQKALRCLRVFGLKFSSELGMALPQSVKLTSRIDLPIGVGGDIHNTEVNAKKLRGLLSWGFLYLANLVKIKIPIAVHKVSLPKKMLKKNEMAITSNEWQSKSATYCPNRNGFVYQLPGEDTLIVSNAPVRVKSPPNTLVNLVGICHLCQDSYHDLSGKVEAVANIIVKQVMQVVLTKGFCFPGMVADMVGSIVCAFQRFQQRLVLFFSRGQFDLRYQFHRYIIAYTSRLDKTGVGI